MPKKRRKYILALGAIISVLWISVNAYFDISFYIKQRELAKRLEVNLHDYSPISFFPENYFYLALEPGITKNHVHSIVVEYEQAFTCGDFREVYYYYSKNKSDAIRFEIIYDFDGRYVKLMGEDDSSTISTEGCIRDLSDKQIK